MDVNSLCFSHSEYPCRIPGCMSSLVNVIVLVQYMKYIMQLSERVNIPVSFTVCDIQECFVLDALIYVKSVRCRLFASIKE